MQVRFLLSALNSKLGDADRKADHDCLFVVIFKIVGIIIRGGKNGKVN